MSCDVKEQDVQNGTLGLLRTSALLTGQEQNEGAFRVVS